MALIPELTDLEAVAEIQKVMDEVVPEGNTKMRISSILNYLYKAAQSGGTIEQEYLKDFTGTSYTLPFDGKDFEIYENGDLLPNEAFSYANRVINFLASAPFFTAQKTNAYIIINYKKI